MSRVEGLPNHASYLPMKQRQGALAPRLSDKSGIILKRPGGQNLVFATPPKPLQRTALIGHLGRLSGRPILPSSVVVHANFPASR
jgi:hypothetical protein